MARDFAFRSAAPSTDSPPKYDVKGNDSYPKSAHGGDLRRVVARKRMDERTDYKSNARKSPKERLAEDKNAASPVHKPLWIKTALKTKVPKPHNYDPYADDDDS